MGYCQLFDGIEDFVNCGNDDSLDITQDITLSAWIKLDGLDQTNNYPRIVCRRQTNPFQGYDIFMKSNNQNVVQTYYDGEGKSIQENTNIALDDDTWYRIDAVVSYYSGDSHVYWYVNGDLDNYFVDPDTFTGSNGDFEIATRYGGAYCFKGWIDEVRVSNIPRDANWIRASYINQNNPSSFYDVGDEEILNGEPPVTPGFFNWSSTDEN